jgi:cobyric acid synthase
VKQDSKMDKCCVPGCKSQDGQIMNIKYHKLPNNKEWIEKLGIAVTDGNTDVAVCSLHFTEESVNGE